MRVVPIVSDHVLTQNQICVDFYIICSAAERHGDGVSGVCAAGDPRALPSGAQARLL